MSEMFLAGVIASAPISASQLIWLEPVVRYENHSFIAAGPTWSQGDLQKLSQSELDYVRPIRSEPAIRLSPGQVIWVAGRNFIGDIAHANLGRFARELGGPSWRLLNEGAKWRTGTVRGLRDLRQQLANELRIQLHRLLFDQLEKSMGDAAQRIFDLYREVDLEPSEERYKTIGLYYFETREHERYSSVRQDAVSERLFKSRKAFDKAVTDLRQWLEVARLSESHLPRASTFDAFINYQSAASLRHLEAYMTRVAATSHRETLLRHLESTKRSFPVEARARETEPRD